MKTRYFFALAAVVLLAGCNKEFQSPEIVITDARTTLEVGIAPAATKTYMGDAAEGERKVYWSNGDQVAVNGIASDALAGVEEASASAQFTFQSVLDTPYNVLYPASAYVDDSQINLPAVQDWDASGFADGFFPMAGYSENGSDIQLAHLCSVLKIQVRQAADGDADKLVAVRFRGGNGEQVSGNFNIFYEKGALVGESTASADQVVMVVKSQATSVEEPVVYYVVVPAGTYSNGFAITVQDANGHIMTKTKPSSMELEPGRQYNMPAFEFVPTGTELGIEISSAAELVAFAQAYNNKTFAALGSSLVATLTADLTFDAITSAAFNATGGIGLKETYGDAEDYYFDGLFNGNGYNIQGLEATAPIFKATSSSGKISNLIIDSSCSFTFTHSNEAELFAAAIVGYHKGSMEGCTVAANITLADAEGITQYTTIGGLAGRVTVGSISDCNYLGLISTPETFKTSSYLMIGGLAGRFSNSGSISSSYFKGAISNAAQVSSTDTVNPSLIIGGVAGYVAGGATISNSEAMADYEEQATAHSTMVGIIVNKTTVAYNSAVGGIVGQLYRGSVSDCTNSAHIALTIFKPGNTSARYMKTGGIVGRVDVEGTVSGCTNKGKVEHRSNPRLQDIGGIAGYNAGSISACTNTAAVNHMTTGLSGITNKGGRIVSIAGIIGENVAGASVSDVHNTADIQISAIEDSYDTTEDKPVCEIRMGGVIAYNHEEIDGGATKNITNSGNVNLTATPTNPFIGFELGGIVGYSSASVKNVSNSGVVINKLSTANPVTRLYMGGVAGKIVNAANVTLSGCENAGEVYFNVNGQAAAHTGNYIGGILGYIVPGGDASASISDCSNSGYAHIACSSTTASTDLCVSGIVGRMAESGVISGCENAGEVALTFSDAAHKDNYAGGVIGKSSGVDVAISDCSNSGYVHGGNGSIKHNGTTMYVGGIIAYLDGVSSIVGCENTGKLLNDQFNNTVTKVGSTFEGGIAGFVVGTADNRISISNVTNDVTLLDKNNQPTKVITGGRRGYTGGAVGYGEYVDITNATNNNTYGGGSGYYIGGIAGWVVNSTVTGSTYAGTAIQTSQVQGAGGIVCTLDAGSVLDGCNSYLATITHAANACVDGAVAAKSVAGSTIKNCHYKAGLAFGICSDSKFTNGGGNVADL